MPLTPVKATYATASRMSARQKAHQYAIIPAPQLGLDYTRPLTMQDPRAANRLENFVVRRTGSELRPGYKRWVSNLPGEVVTVMTYNPPQGAGTVLQSKLFAACDDGKIYDVTDARAESYTPVAAVSIPGQIIPGRFSFTNFATAASNYLCICAAGGGYWTYDSIGGWVNRTGNITGSASGDAINYDFVMAWKNRLWFIVNGTADAHFLNTNSIQGPASPFDFGPLFVHGGAAAAMASWTLDSGNGVDDKLVIVGTSGDVLVYDGTDPTSASTFKIAGRWYVGRPPNGRRFMSKYGGDTILITANGIEYMSRLLTGRSLLDPEGPGDDPATRYNAVIGEEVRSTYASQFWMPVFVSSEQMMVIVTPFTQDEASKQHIFSTLQRAWSQFAGIPMTCGDTLDGELFFGTPHGTLCKLFGAPTDDELQDFTPGREVIGRLQSAYVAPGNDPMALKIPQLLNPMFIAVSPPSAKVQVNTEWNETTTPGAPAYVPPDIALWDVARWDAARWYGGLFTYTGWVGAAGLGVYISFTMTLSGAPRTLFTAWKLVYEPGGIM